MLLEKTTVTIEGHVPSDSTKFEFTDIGTYTSASPGAKPVYTYVKTGTMGVLLASVNRFKLAMRSYMR